MTAGEKNDAALTEAFHAVFDAKDKLPPGTDAAQYAFDALNSIDKLRQSLGFDRIRRFDGDGRPTEPPFLVLTESEAVEVYGALAIAAQVCAAVRDTSGATHYSGLNAIFQDRDGRDVPDRSKRHG